MTYHTQYTCTECLNLKFILWSIYLQGEDLERNGLKVPSQRLNAQESYFVCLGHMTILEWFPQGQSILHEWNNSHQMEKYKCTMCINQGLNVPRTVQCKPQIRHFHKQFAFHCNDAALVLVWSLYPNTQNNTCHYCTAAGHIASCCRIAVLVWSKSSYLNPAWL